MESTRSMSAERVVNEPLHNYLGRGTTPRNLKALVHTLVPLENKGDPNNYAIRSQSAPASSLNHAICLLIRETKTPTEVVVLFGWSHWHEVPAMAAILGIPALLRLRKVNRATGSTANVIVVGNRMRHLAAEKSQVD